jgi:hypothetical protein
LIPQTLIYRTETARIVDSAARILFERIGLSVQRPSDERLIDSNALLKPSH